MLLSHGYVVINLVVLYSFYLIRSSRQPCPIALGCPHSADKPPGAGRLADCYDATSGE